MAPIETCVASHLSADVEALVRPVLAAHSAEDPDLNHAELSELIDSKHPAALEAEVALMAYDLGERPREELLGSVLSARPPAASLVRKYRECRPALRAEWDLPTVVVIRTLYDAYFEQVVEFADVRPVGP
jgi:hypothetical protein